MNRFQFLALAAGTLLLGKAPLMAQQAQQQPPQAQSGRVSPADVTGAVIDGSRVTIYYNRPYTKHPRTGEVRKVWGGLVPFGQVWRLGANEATMLVTQQPLEIGGVTVPAGASTLFLLPQQNGPAKLIVNRQIGQWGTQYDEKQDIGRIDMKMDTLEKSVDQFTMSVARNRDAAGGILTLMWENTQFSVPFTVKK